MLIVTAWYETNAATQMHAIRVISAPDKTAVMRTARRRQPRNAPLVLLARRDDGSIVWYPDSGFTPVADEPHEYKFPYYVLRDIIIGTRFNRQQNRNLPPIYFIKTSERSARKVSDGREIEFDPYDQIYDFGPDPVH